MKARTTEGKPTADEYLALLRTRGGVIAAERRDRGVVVRTVGDRQLGDLEAWTRALGLHASRDGAFDLRVFSFRRRLRLDAGFNNRHED